MNTRFARRLQRIRPSATVGITAKALSLREQGRNIIALSVGEPDFDTPEHIKAAGIEAIRSGDTKYTALDGTSRLRKAIAAKLERENGLEYGADRILVTSGAKQACFSLCLALLDPGDEVVIPAPYWVSFPEMVRLAEGEPVIVHSDVEHEYLINADQLAAAITPATRLVILNSPCNPTGAVYPPERLRELGEVLLEHPRVLVLSDEIYEHISWAPEPFMSFAAACPALFERTVTINGFSKAYAMTGWRLGYAAATPALIKAMSTIQSQSTTNACSISQAAAVAALEGDQTPVRRMCEIFEARHALAHGLLAAIEGFQIAAGRGAFYLLPKIEAALDAKGLADDVEFCEALLDAEGVALVPGTAFGAPGHVRISFAASAETLTEAIGRIARFAAS